MSPPKINRSSLTQRAKDLFTQKPGQLGKRAVHTGRAQPKVSGGWGQSLGNFLARCVPTWLKNLFSRQVTTTPLAHDKASSPLGERPKVTDERTEAKAHLAKISTPDETGRTLLHKTIARGETGFSDAVEMGADGLKQTELKQQRLDSIQKMLAPLNSSEIKQTLLVETECLEGPPIYQAIDYGDPDVVWTLLERLEASDLAAVRDSKLFENETPLEYAKAMHEREKMLSRSGQSPNSAKIIALLERKGLQPPQPDFSAGNFDYD